MKGSYSVCGTLDGIMFHGEQCGSCMEYVYDLSAVGGSYQLY
jgi:hypothetical protein